MVETDNSRAKFKDRVLCDLLPEFSDDRTRGWGSAGFAFDWTRVAERDAVDFLRGLDGGLIDHVGRGLYRAAKSHASEQFFWSGSRSVQPRPITLWIEPIITVAVLARLHFDFSWPISHLGTQSKDWAFDVVAYLADETTTGHVVCEVKKTVAEVDKLISLMARYGADPLDVAARPGSELNAFRKVRSLRERPAPIFWAAGPDTYGRLFLVRQSAEGCVSFVPTSMDALRYKD